MARQEVSNGVVDDANAIVRDVERRGLDRLKRDAGAEDRAFGVTHKATHYNKAERLRREYDAEFNRVTKPAPDHEA